MRIKIGGLIQKFLVGQLKLDNLLENECKIVSVVTKFGEIEKKLPNYLISLPIFACNTLKSNTADKQEFILTSSLFLLCNLSRHTYTEDIYIHLLQYFKGSLTQSAYSEYND